MQAATEGLGGFFQVPRVDQLADLLPNQVNRCPMA
jgi:hypothetical protein